MQRILADKRENPSKTTLVLLSTGKMYYDLVEAREKQGFSNVAILCIDQYYPLRDDVFSKALQSYAPDTPVRWVQEEPENKGAWPFWKNRFCYRLVDRFSFSVVARSASASPATGSSAAHHREQEELIARAFMPPS